MRLGRWPAKAHRRKANYVQVGKVVSGPTTLTWVNGGQTGVTVPLKTVSTLNKREHWAVRARRAKTEREALFLVTPKFPLPCVVTITRVAPRTLDDDNLRGALKSARDGIADRLGAKDNDPRITWVYGQRKGGRGEYAVQVCLEASNPKARQNAPQTATDP